MSARFRQMATTYEEDINKKQGGERDPGGLMDGHEKRERRWAVEAEKKTGTEATPQPAPPYHFRFEKEHQEAGGVTETLTVVTVAARWRGGGCGGGVCARKGIGLCK